MPYIDPKVIAEVKKMDLFTYLRIYEPQELVHISGNVYCTRTHDSLKISNGKWCWHSRSTGGRTALDYLIKVNDMSFMAAVKQIAALAEVQPPVFTHEIQSPPKAEFSLPPMDNGIAEVKRYLLGRGISRELIRYCADLRIIYQTRNGKYPNAVFVGMDTGKTPRYATVRGIRGDFKGDVRGSDKRYSFALPNGSEHLHLFESAVDLLSFATLKEVKTPNFYDGDLLSLSGIYKPRQKTPESALPPALKQYLSDYPQIKNIHLHLDNDLAGRLATQAIMTVLPKQYEVTDEPPPTGKDYNDYLCDRSCLPRTNPQKKSFAR